MLFLAALWILLVIVLFIVPWTWGASRWGYPWPYIVRRRRDYGRDDADVGIDDDYDPVIADEPAPAGGWGLWADILWLIWLALLIWLILWAVFGLV